MTETAPPIVNDPALLRFADPDQLKVDISIDLTNLTGAMQTHASTYVHYAQQAVRARRQFERYKTAVEIQEALLDSKWRTTLKEENPKTTEGQIRAAVVTDPTYRAANSKLIDAQMEFRMAEIAERAFDNRKDMLLQIARDAARESAGPLRVVANQTSRDRLDQMMARTAATHDSSEALPA